MTDQVVSLTQKVGATTGLGQPVNGVLQQTGGLVSNLGTTVKGTGLPGGLGVGVGGLVDGLGKTVASAGGLLNASPNNPDPLKTVLGNATNAVGALTAGLGGQGGLLNPVNKLVGGVTGGVLSGLQARAGTCPGQYGQGRGQPPAAGPGPDAGRRGRGA